MRLIDLKNGERGTVAGFDGPEQLIRRLLEMGVMEEEELSVLRRAPLGDPLEIEIRGYNLSLRKAEAAAVIVERLP